MYVVLSNFKIITTLYFKLSIKMSENKVNPSNISKKEKIYWLLVFIFVTFTTVLVFATIKSIFHVPNAWVALLLALVPAGFFYVISKNFASISVRDADITIRFEGVSVVLFVITFVLLLYFGRENPPLAIQLFGYPNNADYTYIPRTGHLIIKFVDDADNDLKLDLSASGFLPITATNVKGKRIKFALDTNEHYALYSPESIYVTNVDKIEIGIIRTDTLPAWDYCIEKETLIKDAQQLINRLQSEIVKDSSKIEKIKEAQRELKITQKQVEERAQLRREIDTMLKPNKDSLTFYLRNFTMIDCKSLKEADNSNFRYIIQRFQFNKNTNL
jgi:hypothetical protein